MTSIAQTIPNYVQGISSQPDELKPPGTLVDAVNVIPDVTRGLIKRPGSKLIKDRGASITTNVSGTTQAGSWFSYYRDKTEQHIGRIYRDGSVKVWRCSDGDEKTIAANSYLAHSADGDLQFLTINDYTYVTNRTKEVLFTGTTDAYIDSGHYAYVELKQTSNARQYALNLYNPGTDWSNNSNWTTITTATRISCRDNENGTRIHANGIIVTAGGSGYSSTPTVTIKDKDGNTISGRGKSRDSNDVYNDGFFNGNPTATVVNGAVTGINLAVDADNKKGSNDNYGFRHDDIVVISGGGGSNATAEIQRFQPNHTMNSAHRNVIGGSCYDIATGVISINDSDVIVRGSNHVVKTSAKNLVFRFTVTGVSGPIDGSNKIEKAHDYNCMYSYEVELLHGGEGLAVGDYIEFSLEGRDTPVTYIVHVEEIETAKVKADIKAVRPASTPFDQDTAISTTGVLGGITSELTGLTNVTSEIIGNGVYIKKTAAFNIETSENDLMNIITKDVNDVAKLPAQCKHGFIVKVSNSENNVNDDYYLKFVGNNNTDGPGTWVECAQPGIIKSFTASTMPHQIVRQTNGTFTIEQPAWDSRTIGDDNTNVIPSFVSIKSGHPDYDSNTGDILKYINKVLFWRNRLVLLSGENAILSEPGKFTNFWAQTALAISPLDAIDVACSSTFPSKLLDGIETNSGLALFSSNQQFLLTTDSDILNPETAKINSLATYNYNEKISPIHLGTTIGWLDNAGKYSRFFECADIRREGEPQIVEQSKLISRLLVKDVDLVANSRENSFVMFGVSGTKDVYGYRYFNTGNERLQSAWFKWELSDNLLYHVIMDDIYYAVLDGTGNINPLVSFRLKDDDDSAAVTHNQGTSSVDDDVYFPLHLDNWIKGDDSGDPMGTVTYHTNQTLANFRKSTFAVPAGIDSSKPIVAYEAEPSSPNYGRYEIATLNGSTLELTGDWSAKKFYLGYNFTMSLEFPTFYASSTVNRQTRTDVHASLILHRLKLNLGQVGVYETTLKRAGKDDYTELYESVITGDYLSNKPGLLDEYIQTVCAYEKNTNLTLHLTSTHPSPATLYSVSWEGDYTPKYYKRA